MLANQDLTRICVRTCVEILEFASVYSTTPQRNARSGVFCNTMVLRSRLAIIGSIKADTAPNEWMTYSLPQILREHTPPPQTALRYQGNLPKSKPSSREGILILLFSFKAQKIDQSPSPTARVSRPLCPPLAPKELSKVTTTRPQRSFGNIQPSFVMPAPESPQSRSGNASVTETW